MANNTVNYMRKLGIPLTVQNYLDFVYFGNPPEKLDPEEEAALPEELEDDRDPEFGRFMSDFVDEDA